MDANEQVVRSRKRLHLRQKSGLKYFPMSLAELLSQPLARFRHKRRHQHVSAFPDLIMNALVVEFGANRRECLLPGKHMHVVAIDQGPIDIEKHGSYCHVDTYSSPYGETNPSARPAV